MTRCRSFEGRVSRGVTAAVRLALGLGLAGTALAAEPQSTDVLEEIMVTAQFREQNVQETPLSITAISADMLESRNQTNISEVANQAPNVTLKPQGAAFGPSMGASIRGVGQFDFNPALEPGVGLYVDDVYYATLTGSILDLLDLERVEILRGPQGTLAGKNSIGGAVKLYSKKPQGEGGYVSGTYGQRDRINIRASADFAITDNLFARVSGVSKEQGGYIQVRDYGCEHPDSGVPILRSVGTDCVVGYSGDVNYSAMRGALRWVATENLEVGLAADYTRDERSPAGSVLVQTSSTVNPNVQPVQGVTNLPLSAFVPTTKEPYYNYASYYNPPGTFTRLAPPAGATTPMLETRADPRVRYDGWGVSANIDWELSDRLSLTSISAWREYDSYFANDNDLSPLASSLGYGDLSFEFFSQELRLNGAFLTDDRLTYTLGAYYNDQTSVYATTQDLRYSAVGLTQFQGDDPVNADGWAAFAHMSFLLTGSITFNAGVRYTEEHKDYTFHRTTYTGQLHPALGAIDGKTTDYDGDNVDYRANLQFQWTEDLMMYAQVATGFKGGGVSPRPFSAAQAVPFDPETLDSYEVGMKSDWFDRMVRVNLSAFFSDYTDIQLTLNTCPQYGVGLPCAVVANAGDAEVKGIELETVIRPTDALSIDASYSYMDFEYTYINPQVTAIRKGMRPSYVPETKWSAGIQYDFSLGDGGSLTPRVDVSYQGELYTNAANAPTNLIEDYTLANARLTWRNAGGEWETSLEVNNLTNEYYYLTRFDQFTLTGISDGQPGRPREWAVTVKRNF